MLLFCESSPSWKCPSLYEGLQQWWHIFEKGPYECSVCQFFGCDGTDLPVSVRKSLGLACFCDDVVDVLVPCGVTLKGNSKVLCQCHRLECLLMQCAPIRGGLSAPCYGQDTTIVKAEVHIYIHPMHVPTV